MSGGIGPSGDIRLPSEDNNHPETGLKPSEDLAFVLFSLVYMYFISKTAFPPISAEPSVFVFGESNKLLSLYVAAIGLFLPIAYIFEGVFEGDQGRRAARLPPGQPSLRGGLVVLRRILAADPRVFYNSRRIFTIVDWMRGEIWKADEGSARRLYVGRALAVANMAFRCFNLFGFLLPVYLPKAFRIYYQSSHTKPN